MCVNGISKTVGERGRGRGREKKGEREKGGRVVS